MIDGPQNLLSEWARLLLDAFAVAGVAEVVVSPGSRSTPFLLAAEAHPDLRLHVVIDERSAGFFALGLGRASGRPALLLCTSGTAPAHYLPAAIEAGASRVPLIALTADRPFELAGCAAPQTIDQTRLFGEHARAFIDLGMPDASTLSLRALRRRAAQAVHLASWPLPGAVQVNARARKPLEPPGEAGAERGEPERAFAARAESVRAEPLTRVYVPRSAPDARAVEELSRACLEARRGVIVAGPGRIAEAEGRRAVWALAAATGFPLLCEAGSGLRFAGELREALRAHGERLAVIDAFDALLRQPGCRARLAPDLVIQLGPPPISSGWERLVAEAAGCERWVLAADGWNDPASSARALLLGDPASACRALIEQLERRAYDPSVERVEAPPAKTRAFRDELRAANAAAWRAVAEVIEGGPEDAPVPLGEAEAVRAAVRSVPRGAFLMLGNSLPVREVDACCPAGSADCEVLTQRGASGIDGLVSGAAGAAATGRATTLLLGDVSFLHDLGGLRAAGEAAERAGVPLVIVVVHNDGGRIFEQLPLARRPGADLRRWTTPHGLSLEPAAALFGVSHERADTRAELEAALARAQRCPGCSLIEARVAPDSARLFSRAVDQRLAALLDDRR